jgi:hypothetical protein
MHRTCFASNFFDVSGAGQKPILLLVNKLRDGDAVGTDFATMKVDREVSGSGKKAKAKHSNFLTRTLSFYDNELEIMRIPKVRDLHRLTSRLAYVLNPGL